MAWIEDFLLSNFGILISPIWSSLILYSSFFFPPLTLLLAESPLCENFGKGEGMLSNFPSYLEVWGGLSYSSILRDCWEDEEDLSDLIDTGF